MREEGRERQEEGRSWRVGGDRAERNFHRQLAAAMAASLETAAAEATAPGDAGDRTAASEASEAGEGEPPPGELPCLEASEGGEEADGALAGHSAAVGPGALITLSGPATTREIAARALAGTSTGTSTGDGAVVAAAPTPEDALVALLKAKAPEAAAAEEEREEREREESSSDESSDNGLDEMEERFPFLYSGAVGVDGGGDDNDYDTCDGGNDDNVDGDDDDDAVPWHRLVHAGPGVVEDYSDDDSDSEALSFSEVLHFLEEPQQQQVEQQVERYERVLRRDLIARERNRTPRMSAIRSARRNALALADAHEMIALVDGQGL